MRSTLLTRNRDGYIHFRVARGTDANPGAYIEAKGSRSGRLYQILVDLEHAPRLKAMGQWMVDESKPVGGAYVLVGGDEKIRSIARAIFNIPPNSGIRRGRRDPSKLDFREVNFRPLSGKSRKIRQEMPKPTPKPVVSDPATVSLNGAYAIIPQTLTIYTVRRLVGEALGEVVGHFDSIEEAEKELHHKG